MFFVIGLGSMGRRRVRCLLANGILPKDILGFDRREDRRTEAVQKHGIGVTDHVEDLARADVQAVFVSVWPNFHTDYCRLAAENKKDWFCEVPLALELRSLDKLRSLTESHRLIGAVGSQMIFHPASEQLARWLSEDAAGKLVTGWGTCTSYFPEWHPWEDYRSFYVSDKHAGGANIDMLGHELQWMCWLLGREVIAVNARTNRLGNLELTDGSYDSAEIIIEFTGGLLITMHFDGVNRGMDRGLWLVGNDTSLHWDLKGPKAWKADPAKKEWIGFGPETFEYEQAYVREIGHFLRCLKTREAWPVKFDSALNVIRFIQAVDVSSAQDGRRVALSELA